MKDNWGPENTETSLTVLHRYITLTRFGDSDLSCGKLTLR